MQTRLQIETYATWLWCKSATPPRPIITPVLDKELKNQISYASHQAFLTFDNYAAHAIILALASLVCWKDGIHHSMLALKAYAVQEANCFTGDCVRSLGRILPTLQIIFHLVWHGPRELKWHLFYTSGPLLFPPLPFLLGFQSKFKGQSTQLIWCCQRSLKRISLVTNYYVGTDPMLNADTQSMLNQVLIEELWGLWDVVYLCEEDLVCAGCRTLLRHVRYGWTDGHFSGTHCNNSSFHVTPSPLVILTWSNKFLDKDEGGVCAGSSPWLILLCGQWWLSNHVMPWAPRWIYLITWWTYKL
jgi:hypothetical protein